MNKVKFGKKIVEIKTKKKLVKNLFNKVSSQYDLMNDLMSFGLHRLWKKDLIQNIDNSKPSVILDLAGGTGDISKRLSKKFKKSSIIIYDLSYEMIKKAKYKFKNKNIFCINGSAELMPLPDNCIDLITLSFGLRNFSDTEASIQECYRVLKYGGKIYCLEFSPSYSKLLKPSYNFYSTKIIPKIGRLVAKNENAYQYLTDSIQSFYYNPELKNIFNKNGFFCYTEKKYLGGIAILNVFSKV
jgi:demethylmenaquinone methyltransferase/2-methoxy-6-polyprenyl-1,4-benzoquinol methylase